MVPVHFLDIQPHHRVLDMCASPGSKTTQALEYLGNDGKKLIFFDGVIIKNGVTLNDRITFLIKEDETSKEFMTRVRQGKEKLRVGDIIKFTGSFENENYFINFFIKNRDWILENFKLIVGLHPDEATDNSWMSNLWDQNGYRTPGTPGSSSRLVSIPGSSSSNPRRGSPHCSTPTPKDQHPLEGVSSAVWTAVYDYEAQGEDELTLEKGDTIEVLSKDYLISGDEGWWTGKCEGSVGVFPCNFVAPKDQDFSNLKKEELLRFCPPHISFGELTLEEVIGVGGFGKVYRGFYRGMEVAVKAARRDAEEEVGLTKERVLQEGRLFWLLKHQNIVDLLGILEGKLDLMCSLIGPFKWHEACSTYTKGLPFSLVHRDLKSANVLILEDIEKDDNLLFKTLKITDFGLARESANTTRMSAAGTYAWMAPEVIKSSMFSKASDVWSYSIWSCCKQINSSYPTTVPQEWRNLMEACWNYDTQVRPDFQEILKILDEVAHSNFNQMPDNSSTIYRMIGKKKLIKCSWKLGYEKHELRSKEAELDDKQREQRLTEERLKQREAELAEREKDLLHRELNQNISGPSDFRHHISLTPSRNDLTKMDRKMKKYVPADGVKGKTWGPSSGSNKKTSATGIVPELDRSNRGLYYYQRPFDNAGIPMATLYNNIIPLLLHHQFVDRPMPVSSEDGTDVQYPPPPPVSTGPGLDMCLLFLPGHDYSSSDGHYTTTNNNNSNQSYVPPSRQYVETPRRLDSLESVRSRQESIESPRSRGLDLIDHTNILSLTPRTGWGHPLRDLHLDSYLNSNGGSQSSPRSSGWPNGGGSSSGWNSNQSYAS
ncbi:MAP3K9 [Lepeophtheirus salmonis]|uniref:mitogen-activated protein kinase kinase kinase n=1 Tax=Lepeophtheirus salmonis TaxID=72036 RepID=A0A7R8CIH1_LEPSM|nr:MAP3K9 [Lepeophtheirus salmonis]CAF2830581.1 MAP3K9 [Lepeophtheirus salmonis]